MKVRGFSKEKAEDIAREVLAKVDMSDKVDVYPGQLSGGQKQRVAIARSLINGPQILFADEPTGNLDSSTGGALMETLMNLVSEKQKTLIVVTHDSELASLGAVSYTHLTLPTILLV